MHISSLKKMKGFYLKYLSQELKVKRNVLDIGSKNINGTYKDIFPEKSWNYIGLDQEPGENVDLIVKNPYRWDEVPTSSFDVLISGQSLEHIEFPWKTFEEMYRILKPSGLACIIAPSSGPEHKYPFDCWRFYPDGMRALCKHSGFKCIEVTTDWNPKCYEDGSEIWKDTMLVAQK